METAKCGNLMLTETFPNKVTPKVTYRWSNVSKVCSGETFAFQEKG